MLNLSISIISHVLVFLNVHVHFHLYENANGNYTGIQPKYHCPSHRLSTNRVSLYMFLSYENRDENLPFAKGMFLSLFIHTLLEQNQSKIHSMLYNFELPLKARPTLSTH